MVKLELQTENGNEISFYNLNDQCVSVNAAHGNKYFFFIAELEKRYTRISFLFSSMIGHIRISFSQVKRE